MKLRQVIISSAMPLIWRYFPSRKLAALQDFSMIEIDSGWQSLQAIPSVADPTTKKMLFLHAMEEFDHGSRFDRLYGEISDSLPRRPVFRRERMLREGGGKEELLDFLAGAYVGERDVNEDFRYYMHAPIDPRIRAIFASILQEEEGHEGGALEHLERMAGGNRNRIRWLVRKHSLKRLYKLYIGMLQKLGELPLSIVLSAVYFLLGPFVFFPLRTRMLLPREEQLAILKRQVVDLRERLRNL